MRRRRWCTSTATRSVVRSRVTGDRLRAFVDEEWGGRLIRGWDERWYRPAAHARRRDRPGLPRCRPRPDDGRRLDDRAALQAGPGRGRRPAGPRRDRHRLRQLPHRPLHRRGHRGRARPDRAVDRRRPRGRRHRRAGPRGRGRERTAVVVLSQVAYRSGHLADVEAITAVVHDAGALVAVGPVPLGRVRAGRARRAGASTSRWGAPTSTSTAGRARPPSPTSPSGTSTATGSGAASPSRAGWATRTRSSMGPGYQPSGGIRRFISGTPAIVGMLAMQDMLALIERAGVDAVRTKSRGPDVVRRRPGRRLARRARRHRRPRRATRRCAAGT